MAGSHRGLLSAQFPAVRERHLRAGSMWPATRAATSSHPPPGRAACRPPMGATGLQRGVPQSTRKHRPGMRPAVAPRRTARQCCVLRRPRLRRARPAPAVETRAAARSQESASARVASVELLGATPRATDGRADRGRHHPGGVVRDPQQGSGWWDVLGGSLAWDRIGLKGALPRSMQDSLVACAAVEPRHATLCQTGSRVESGGPFMRYRAPGDLPRPSVVRNAALLGGLAGR